MFLELLSPDLTLYSGSVTRRRWIADTWSERIAFLRGEQAHHLARVLRATPGMEFDVVAGDRVWRATVRDVSDEAVSFDLIVETAADTALPLTLLLSVFKFDRMEWAIEKVTELGVSAIVPVLARRTEKHLAQAANKRAERWRRIALEAAKQSRRASIPEIRDPLPLQNAIALSPAADAVRLLLTEDEQETSLPTALDAQTGAGRTDAALWLAIGPEGGWTPDEYNAFTQEGRWKTVSLGPRILRAETAAIAAVAICGSAWLQREAARGESEREKPQSVRLRLGG